MKHLFTRTRSRVLGAGVVALAVGLAPAAAVAAPVAAHPVLPRTVTIESVVHLSGNLSASTTSGTFAAAGALTDSGTESGSGRFAGQGATPAGPNILHATQTFTGTHGSITITLVGDFGPLPAPTAQGAGEWAVTSASGGYAGVHGAGTWHAVADFTGLPMHIPPTVTFLFTGLAT